MRDAAEAGADSLLIADVPALEAEPLRPRDGAGGDRAGADRRCQHARADAAAHRELVEGLHLLRQPRGHHRHARRRRIRRRTDPPRCKPQARRHPSSASESPSPSMSAPRSTAGARGVICGSAIVDLAVARRRCRGICPHAERVATRNESLRNELNRLCSEGDDLMAARPIWRGQIRLALVSIPVELYSGDQERRADPVPPGARADRQADQIREGRARHRPGRPRRDRQGL